jgi:acetylornithine deacetylase
LLIIFVFCFEQESNRRKAIQGYDVPRDPGGSTMNETVELLSSLVAIDSVNPELVPGGAGEAQIADFIANWLKRAGIEVIIDEPVSGRPNIVGIVRGTGGGRTLMLNAHTDTVGVTGMQQPYQPVVKDGCLYGRGAFDMKGGLAAILLAAVAAKQQRLRGDVILTAVVDEEHASIGTSSIIKHWHADGAILTEPTGLDICVAHKGFVWLEVETQGRSAHGSRPDLGIDAIAMMGKILVGLEQLGQFLRTAPGHPLLGTGSLHASLIRGGQELSSYPERCILSIERRTIPGETAQSVISDIYHICEQINADASLFTVEVRTILERVPFEISTHEPVVQIIHRQATRLLDRVPAYTSSWGWMDSAILATAGIPTVIFGPGGSGAHAAVEWGDLASIERCTKVLIATIEEFCR